MCVRLACVRRLSIVGLCVCGGSMSSAQEVDGTTTVPLMGVQAPIEYLFCRGSEASAEAEVDIVSSDAHAEIWIGTLFPEEFSIVNVDTGIELWSGWTTAIDTGGQTKDIVFPYPTHPYQAMVSLGGLTTGAMRLVWDRNGGTDDAVAMYSIQWTGNAAAFASTFVVMTDEAMGSIVNYMYMAHNEGGGVTGLVPVVRYVGPVVIDDIDPQSPPVSYQSVVLRDDGVFPDHVADDGVYVEAVDLEQVGTYIAKASVDWSTERGLSSRSQIFDVVAETPTGCAYRLWTSPQPVEIVPLDVDDDDMFEQLVVRLDVAALDPDLLNTTLVIEADVFVYEGDTAVEVDVGEAVPIVLQAGRSIVEWSVPLSAVFPAAGQIQVGIDQLVLGDGSSACTLLDAPVRSGRFDAQSFSYCPADVNQDWQVTPADFNAWIIAFNEANPLADMNGDGLLTPADFNAWIYRYNLGC